MATPNTSPTKAFIVQDTWNEDEDIELREYLEGLPQAVAYMNADEILKLQPDPGLLIFADSNVIQRLIDIVPSYPPELKSFFGRTIVQQTIGSIHHPYPYFVKLAGSNKTTMAQVIRTAEDETKLRTELSDASTLVYVSDPVDFFSEWRLFLSPDRLWGCQEYSEHMIGHRLYNSDENTSTILEIKEIPHVPKTFVTAIRNAAKPLGFVVVDVGLTAEGIWCLVECNPPFALSSYGLPMDVYVEFCVAAWKNLLAKVPQGDK